MFALSFDLTISELEKYYGVPYNKAYYDVRKALQKDGFEWVQGSTYMTHSDSLNNLVAAILHLKQIDWFRNSVRDIRGYRVEDWSDFTELVKE